MREAVIITFIGGAFFAALGAMVAALAIKNATPALLWDLVLWGGVAMVIGSIISLGLFLWSQSSGRPFVGPALSIDFGLCLIAIGLVWYFSKEAVDNEYIFFKVEISDPRNLTGLLPVWISNQAPGPFYNVDVCSVLGPTPLIPMIQLIGLSGTN
jgi:hypothetical protein